MLEGLILGVDILVFLCHLKNNTHCSNSKLFHATGKLAKCVLKAFFFSISEATSKLHLSIICSEIIHNYTIRRENVKLFKCILKCIY